MSFRRAASGLFLAILCIFAAARGARAQGGVDPPEADPTHYWSYRLSPSFFFSSVIEVKDPFFPGYTTVFLDSLQRVANWVVKDAAALPDTTKRLTWWNIRNKLPNQSSGIVRNQRGEFTFDVLELQFLLAPASLHQPGVGHPALNHFLCYRAIGLTPTGTYHRFDDSWTTDFQLLGAPTYLCAPCTKRYEGVEYPPPAPQTWLSLYEITPHSDLLSARVEDQFIGGFRAFRQRSFEYAMLPSTFTPFITPARPSTWGRVKALYRD